jgi:alpha-L-rhamnosidase
VAEASSPEQAPFPPSNSPNGEILAAKILAGPPGADAPTLLISDPHWLSSTTISPSWESPSFDDHAWLPTASLGAIESNIDFFQWNADAGMYAWPGYRGLSAPLRTYALPAAAATHIFPSSDAFTPIAALTTAAPFTVTLAPPTATDAEAPSLILDFGREVAGRLLVESASTVPITLSIAYGESELEAQATGLAPGQQGGNYLGTNLLEVPPNGTARGPKSAFRFVRIQFLRGPAQSALKSIRLEGIYYPVPHTGTFESSDPLLNRIWETGAYTAHLCMQDGLWDAPKRDRGRWVGDIDVEGRVLETAFGDPTLIEDTLRRLAESTPSTAHVNGISSYTALWLTSLQTLYQHTGDVAFVRSQHAAILQLLARLDRDLGPDNLLLPNAKGWNFVDWSPGLYAQTPNARIGTELQYLRGDLAGVYLLQTLGDGQAASKYTTRAFALKAALQKLFDPATQTLGPTWQLNTLAVLTHLPATENIWPTVLAHLKQDAPTDQVISPYFGTYLLDAFSELGHQAEALAWIRAYWGGMIAQGATSFWESYDLRWPKGPNFALSLQADGTSGFFVSLAHGWSSGPTAWLTENILGVTPLTPGYDTVAAPHLLGLTFARGSVPTPHGPISISIDANQGILLDLPRGVTSAAVTPIPHPGTTLYLDGTPIQGDTIQITHPGHHTLQSR